MTDTNPLREAIATQISEGLGAILRKFCDSPQAAQARHYLHAMPESDWNTLIGMLAEESANVARAALAAAPQPKPKQTMCDRCDGSGYAWAVGTCPDCDGAGWITSQPVSQPVSQPAPVDREALVEVLRPYVGVGMARALAEALLARGLRLPGDETIAWALVGDDEAVLADTVRWERGDVDAMFGDLGPSVRVAIRVVDGDDGLPL